MTKSAVVLAWPINEYGHSEIRLPKGSKILKVSGPANMPLIWTLTEPGWRESENRVFLTLGTGEYFYGSDDSLLSYLGSTSDKEFEARHIFEVVPK
jgi:hypothetical protein